jgi:hypothetical protein
VAGIRGSGIEPEQQLLDATAERIEDLLLIAIERKQRVSRRRCRSSAVRGSGSAPAGGVRDQRRRVGSARARGRGDIAGSAGAVPLRSNEPRKPRLFNALGFPSRIIAGLAAVGTTDLASPMAQDRPSGAMLMQERKKPCEIARAPWSLATNFYITMVARRAVPVF